MAKAGVARTMYKVLMIGLVLYAVASGLVFANYFGTMWGMRASVQAGGMFSVTGTVLGLLIYAAQFVLALAAAYWVPKALRRLFAEEFA